MLVYWVIAQDNEEYGDCWSVAHYPTKQAAQEAIPRHQQARKEEEKKEGGYVWDISYLLCVAPEKDTYAAVQTWTSSEGMLLAVPGRKEVLDDLFFQECATLDIKSVGKWHQETDNTWRRWYWLQQQKQAMCFVVNFEASSTTVQSFENA